jgi:hypothetical protein
METHVKQTWLKLKTVIWTPAQNGPTGPSGPRVRNLVGEDPERKFENVSFQNRPTTKRIASEIRKRSKVAANRIARRWLRGPTGLRVPSHAEEEANDEFVTANWRGTASTRIPVWQILKRSGLATKTIARNGPTGRSGRSVAFPVEADLKRRFGNVFSRTELWLRSRRRVKKEVGTKLKIATTSLVQRSLLGQSGLNALQLGKLFRFK